jgi:hypothetical protein
MSAKPIIARAIRAFASGLNDELRRTFYLWKIGMLNETIRKKERDRKVAQGVARIEKISEQKPRNALRSMDKARERRVKVDDAFRKLLLIYKHGVRRCFDAWKGNSNLQGQAKRITKAADTCM